MADCTSCSVVDICDKCAEGFYWLVDECKAHVECKETEHEAYNDNGEQICTLCSETSYECKICSKLHVCTECNEGF
jgi:hypothetical protein